MTTKQKNILFAIFVGVIVTGMGFAGNFIRWDETPLEQSIWAIPLFTGLLLQIPFLFIVSLFTPEPTYFYPMLWVITPPIAGFVYGSVTYLLLRKHTQKTQKKS